MLVRRVAVELSVVVLVTQLSEALGYVIRSVLDNNGSTLVSRLDYYVNVRGELFYRLGLVVVDVFLLGALGYAVL